MKLKRYTEARTEGSIGGVAGVRRVACAADDNFLEIKMVR